MRKDEAAKFLGISVRTLELYTQQARIGGHYEKGKTRPVLVYDEAELKRFKDELDGQNYPHRPVIERTPKEQGRHERTQTGSPEFNVNAAYQAPHQAGLNGSQSGGPMGSALALSQSLPPQMEQLFTALMALGAQSAAQQTEEKREVPIEHRLFLNLEEAQSFTGLSRGILQKAIKAGELPAKIMGRGWRIKRADLEAYAENMSMTAEA